MREWEIMGPITLELKMLTCLLFLTTTFQPWVSFSLEKSKRLKKEEQPRILFFFFRTSSRLRDRASTNFRQKEKEILDQVLDYSIYDYRIRPAGLVNDTSKLRKALILPRFILVQPRVHFILLWCDKFLHPQYCNNALYKSLPFTMAFFRVFL